MKITKPVTNSIFNNIFVYRIKYLNTRRYCKNQQIPWPCSCPLHTQVCRQLHRHYCKLYRLLLAVFTGCRRCVDKWRLYHLKWGEIFSNVLPAICKLYLINVLFNSIFSDNIFTTTSKRFASYVLFNSNFSEEDYYNLKEKIVLKLLVLSTFWEVWDTF